MAARVTLCHMKSRMPPNRLPLPTRRTGRIAAMAVLLVLSAPAALAWPQKEASPDTFPPLGSQCESLDAEPITYGMQYDLPGSGLPDEIRDIHDVWLAGGCVGCHNQTAMGGLRLDTPDFAGYELVLANSFRNSEIFRVVPNRPESSLLYAMINCTPPGDYPFMPPATDQLPVRLSPRLRALVYDWIAQGARGFDAFGAPYSDVVFRDSMESSRQQFNLVMPTPMRTP